MAYDMTITRRAWVARVLGTFAGGTALNAVPFRLALAALAPARLTVYKDPSCECCTKWVAHLRANGLETAVHERSDMDALKDRLGVPAALRSCHTAVSGKYLIEGHVPAADVKKLFSTAPTGVLGLAVPGMPNGSPGMETSGLSDRYDVLAFSADGKSHVFASYG